MKKLLTLFIISILLFVTACTGTENNNVISVSGTSTIKADPDRAVFYVSIQSLKDTATLAQTDNSKRTQTVIDALLAQGLDKKDIETQNYNIYKREDWTEQGSKFKGYQADNTIKVTVEDITNVGKYIDAAISNGADSIQSVNFELSEATQKEKYAEAIKQAGNDAQQQAENLAASVGAKLGKIVRVSGSNSNYYPLPIYKDLMVAESGRAAAVPINPQQLEVTATVNVDYSIR
ncbi:MAG: SIMPL domain-containing protein [Nanoarchaeota archaeon]|nr:SIMPL domain-containing protein [Nanoarchaeota archaeon]